MAEGAASGVGEDAGAAADAAGGVAGAADATGEFARAATAGGFFLRLWRVTQRGRVLQVLNSLGCASRQTMAGASAASA